ncbi:hypothetical protein MP228_012983 [Amoeboaphelidium protococcarum]|nr:hypothetical protein MP228_012983 [Amoeboaphelidium protococcarum]
MKSIAKNFGKLNQLVGEKFAGASKHETSQEFKELEARTEARKDAIEAILEASNAYMKTLEKKKETALEKGAKQLPVENLGGAMIDHGSDLPEESEYGKALLKVGEAENMVGKIQQEFAATGRECFVARLEEYMQEVKTYKHLKSKLENRRLDYDAKVNRLQKSKKENPNLDEEMRAAQLKYEETLQELETLMISLNDKEQNQLDGLIQFLDAQYEYHQKAVDLLGECKRKLANKQLAGNRLHGPKSFFSASQSSLNQNMEGVKVGDHQSEQYDSFSNETPRKVPVNGVQMLQPDGGALQVPRQNRLGSAMTYSTASGGTTAMPSRQVSEYQQGENVSQRPVPTLPETNALNRKIVRANYSFTAENKNELSLNKGDVVTVIQEVDEGWWIGDLNGKKGLFPANYVEVIPKSVNGSGSNTRLASTSTENLQYQAKPAVNFANKPSFGQSGMAQQPQMPQRDTGMTSRTSAAASSNMTRSGSSLNLLSSNNTNANNITN